MRTTNIGLAEWRVTANTDEKLLAIGIGSCVAVALYDPQLKLGALAHIMLPNGPLTEPLPAKFVNVMVPLLIGDMQERGAQTILTAVFGGATLLGSGQSLLLDIGRRNVEAAVRCLTELSHPPLICDTGGTRGRSVELNIASGLVTVRILGSPDAVYEELTSTPEGGS